MPTQSNVGLPKVSNTTNATTAVVLANIKNTPGRVRHVVCSNVSATARYVKLYDKATAPVAASDHPVITIAVPANGTYTIADVNLRFANGISIGISGLAPDTDATVLTAGFDIKAMVSYF